MQSATRERKKDYLNLAKFVIESPMRAERERAVAERWRIYPNKDSVDIYREGGSFFKFFHFLL